MRILTRKKLRHFLLIYLLFKKKKKKERKEKGYFSFFLLHIGLIFLFFRYRLSCKTWRASSREAYQTRFSLSLSTKRSGLISLPLRSSSLGSRKTVISFSQTPSQTHAHTLGALSRWAFVDAAAVSYPSVISNRNSIHVIYTHTRPREELESLYSIFNDPSIHPLQSEALRSVSLIKPNATCII